MVFAPLPHLTDAPPFLAAFVFALALFLALIQIRFLRFASLRLGIHPGAAIGLLLASLIGSAIDIPVAQLAPEATGAKGVLLAVNLGGAAIPAALSLYLMARRRLWGRGVVVVAIMAFLCHALARPIHGVGIALPTFAPPLAAALVAALADWRELAPLAYVGGSLGVLIGADLTHLDQLRGLGAPVASIGGAGTFDGIFVTGLFAVFLASLARPDEASG